MLPLVFWSFSGNIALRDLGQYPPAFGVVSDSGSTLKLWINQINYQNNIYYYGL